MSDDGQLSEQGKQALVQLFPRIKAWRERTSAVSLRPAPGSQLAKDDQLVHPYQISHAATGALVSAVDHMDALRTLVEDAHVVHARAPLTLLRGSLENASVAVWLLAASNRKERIRRRLRWQWEDEKYGVEAAKLIGRPHGPTLDERKAKIAGVARACELDDDDVARLFTRGVSFGWVVKTAGDEALGGPAVRRPSSSGWARAVSLTYRTGRFSRFFSAKRSATLPKASSDYTSRCPITSCT